MTTSTDYFNQATIQIGSASSPSIERFACHYHGVDGQRLSLSCSRRVQSSTAVTIEYDDVLFMGEVVACTQAIGDTWHVEVKIEQILNGLQSLMNLRSNLMGAAAPVSPRMAPAVVSR